MIKAIIVIVIIILYVATVAVMIFLIVKEKWVFNRFRRPPIGDDLIFFNDADDPKDPVTPILKNRKAIENAIKESLSDLANRTSEKKLLGLIGFDSDLTEVKNKIVDGKIKPAGS
ncbi:MAG: hypothetical protein KatS3mg101_0801 [Patescibacteria group bacterium]|nr:MAG: hypothetical protein KatS3mg101_0801 [Patescibacteria group bacterium]